MVSGDKCCMRDCQRVEQSSRPATKLANRLPDLCDATLQRVSTPFLPAETQLKHTNKRLTKSLTLRNADILGPKKKKPPEKKLRVS